MPKDLQFLEASSRLLTNSRQVGLHPALTLLQASRSTQVIELSADRAGQQTMQMVVGGVVLIALLIAAFLCVQLGRGVKPSKAPHSVSDLTVPQTLGPSEKPWEAPPPRPPAQLAAPLATDISHTAPYPTPMPPPTPQKAFSIPTPCATAVVFQDPRVSRRREVGVVGFAARSSAPHESGKLGGPDACDVFCCAGFLSVAFNCGPEGFYVPTIQGGPFRSVAEAMDMLGGYVDWQAMDSILRAKFAPGTALATALLQTGDAFLLEHGGDSGENWGPAGNRLGLQLMIIRDSLQSAHPRPATGEDADITIWSQWAWDVCKIDLATGQHDPAGHSAWQTAVKSATSKVLLTILQEVNKQTMAASGMPLA